MSEEQKGAVAFKHNASFIDSIIQCLSQTPKITQYFLDNKHLVDINNNDELGYIATRYGILLQQIWSNKYDIIDSHYNPLPGIVRRIISE